MKTIKRILQVFAGLACGFGCLELGIRTISPHAGSSFLFQAPENAPNGMYVRDQKLIYKPNPGFSAQSVSPGYSVPIRINSLSLRGGELTKKTKERWLVMGDSFGFSAQVSEENHFIGRLNQTGSIEFLNGGADGYGTWQSLLRYRSLRKKAELDGLVVLFFVGNDFFDNQHFEGMQRKASSQQQGQPLLSKTKNPIELFLSRRSYLYAHWKIYQRAQKFKHDPQAHSKWKSELMLYTQPTAPQQMINATDRVFRELARSLPPQKLIVAIASPYFVVEEERRKTTFDMVQLPIQDVDIHRPIQFLTQILDKYQIPYCDLSPDLTKTHKKGTKQYLSFDGHWTIEGHQTVAQTIHRCMSENFGTSSK